MQVLKFGGSSVAHASSIERLLQITREKPKDTYIIVISAFGGITDQLISCGQEAAQGKETYKTLLEIIETRHLDTIREIFPLTNQSHLISRLKKDINQLENLCDGIFQVEELSKRSLDKIMSFGELTSSYLIAEKLKQGGLNTNWKDSRKLIVTDTQFGCAQVDFIDSNHQITQYFRQEKAQYIVLPGFIAATRQQETTTLGRGGSDYTAAILAGAIRATSLEIWTDVSGMMTADPRIVTQSFPIEHISYEEAMELSHFGAKVIYPPTIQPAMEQHIPILIKNTFAPYDAGTQIHKHRDVSISQPVTGISGIQQIALLTLEGSGMVGIPSYSKRLFETLSCEKINVIFITQSSSEHSITVGIHECDMLKSKTIIDREFSKEIYQKHIEPLSVDKDLCIIAIVGDNMKNLHGTNGKMFAALGRNSINVRAIAQGSTEKNISAVIGKNDFKKALNILHEAFFETPTKQINLFITGVGQVGSKLLEQLYRQQAYLCETLKLQLRVIGLANSKKMHFDEQGIDLNDWNLFLQKGETMNVTTFIQKIEKLNLRNSLFVDNTADQEMAATYENFLQKGIGVITCNKIACSSDYSYYKKLKTLARHFNAPFFFETNVGAGLPVISTLNDLINSGDKIHRIEAVLSGSLNFIFNHFIGNISFVEVVKEAQNQGYTEPDPRIDLSGVDVMRKILILARECGNTLEMKDISQKSFLPQSCQKTPSVETFYKQLEAHADHFSQLREAAKKDGKCLRFIARYEKGATSVGLEAIGPKHPFYQLEGKDNMILYLTHRYTEQPLIVKGAGAGAEVTASGVFSDIIKASR
ncbi:MAG: bifunctional aspartate kinase/homoserine dehydrogenase I [Flavobacteriales bacterium AspAUS03]